jgi:hypothetical protein
MAADCLSRGVHRAAGRHTVSAAGIQQERVSFQRDEQGLGTTSGGGVSPCAERRTRL